MPTPHFLIISFPAQGHINPVLQLAKRLLCVGARVTYALSNYGYRRMVKTSIPDGLSIVTFSDGYDDGFEGKDGDTQRYMSELKRSGSETLTQLIKANEREGNPITCLVYTLLLPWVVEVARGFHLRSALLWVQPASVFNIYYYYFKGYSDVIRRSYNEVSCFVELPSLPLLTSRDLPTFLDPSNVYVFGLPAFEEQFVTLSEENRPTILFNTFDALEPEALKAIEKFNMIAVGPLMPLAFSDKKHSLETSFRDHLFRSPHDYLEWLNLQAKSSVIYMSFGSISVLSKPQMEEIASGLLESGRPFLWVIRAKDDGEEEDKLSCQEELEKQGKIVKWCKQVEVLSHEAVGCFLTHCGWNSTLESLVSGVPVVAFPQWVDQTTNAKLIEDVWKTGVRVNPNEDGVVESGEIKRCLDLVMGGEERGKEMKRNAEKWRELAREAVREGGSSDKNLKAFVDDFDCQVVS